MSYKGLEVVHIVAMDIDKGIGKDNTLMWNIPNDMKHFKKLTKGGVVVMGRKTYDSIGSALPDRVNVVVSASAKSHEIIDAFIGRNILQALEIALIAAKRQELDHFFIIGGAAIYEQTNDIVDRLEQTLVHSQNNGADTFYPMLKNWKRLMISKREIHDGLAYNFRTYIKGN